VLSVGPHAVPLEDGAMSVELLLPALLTGLLKQIPVKPACGPRKLQVADVLGLLGGNDMTSYMLIRVDVARDRD
jgi:hypothetical protein